MRAFPSGYWERRGLKKKKKRQKKGTNKGEHAGLRSTIFSVIYILFTFIFNKKFYPAYHFTTKGTQFSSKTKIQGGGGPGQKGTGIGGRRIAGGRMMALITLILGGKSLTPKCVG